MNRATPKFWGVYLVHLLSTIHIDPMGFSVSEFNSRLLFQKIGSPSIFCQSPRNEHGKVNTDLQDFLRFLWFCSGKTMKNHTKTKWKSGSSMKTHSLGKKPTNSLSDQELAWVFSCPSCLAPTSGSDVFFFWGGVNLWVSAWKGKHSVFDVHFSFDFGGCTIQLAVFVC